MRSFHYLGSALATVHLHVPLTTTPDLRLLASSLSPGFRLPLFLQPSTLGAQLAGTISCAVIVLLRASSANAKHVGEGAAHSRGRAGREILACETLLQGTGDWQAPHYSCSSWHYLLWRAIRYVLRLRPCMQQAHVAFLAGKSMAVNKAELCLTPACVHAASELLYNLSPNYKELDPCDNFEELVCGGWRDRHDLRADQGDAFTGTIMSEQSQLLLRHILEAPYPKDSQV